jgi:hypothetical protein
MSKKVTTKKVTKPVKPATKAEPKKPVQMMTEEDIYYAPGEEEALMKKNANCHLRRK